MKTLLKSGIAALVVSLFALSGLTTAQAAVMTYTFSITGDVVVGDETSPNVYGLTAGDTISATGSFIADLGTIGSESGTVLFGSGSGNSLSIDLNGTILTASDDNGFAGGTGPYLTFSLGDLTDFDFQKSGSPTEFNSSFVYFDDFDQMFGQWQSNANLQVVPLPAGIWLLGSGLLALAGSIRRRH
jgi:hypothetical protein